MMTNRVSTLLALFSDGIHAMPEGYSTYIFSFRSRYFHQLMNALDGAMVRRVDLDLPLSGPSQEASESQRGAE